MPPTSTLVRATAVPMSTYTVQYNDTLFTVASQFHVDMAVFLGMNTLGCDSLLAVGKAINIPPAYPYSEPLPRTALTLRNVKQLALEHIVDCASKINALDFSPDGNLLAVAEDDFVYLWNVGDWKPYLRLKGHLSDVTSVQFSPDGQTLVSGSYDATLKLWKVSDGSLIYTFKGHTNQVTDVAFHPGGQQIISTARDLTARLWQIDGSLLHTFSGYSTFSAAFSPDGGSLALGYADSVSLYRLSDLSVISSLASADVVSHLVFSPDGLLLASSSDLWHVNEGRQIYHFRSSGDTPVFTSDGQALFTGRRVWRIANGTQIWQMASPLAEAPRTGDVWDSLAYSPANGLLAWGTPEGLYIYSLPADTTGDADASSRLHVAATGDTIYNIATTYGVDLQKLLSLNQIDCDSPIFAGQNLWMPDNADLIPDLSQREPLQPGNASQLSELRSFAMKCTLTNSNLIFSPDVQKLVSGSALWDVPTGSINIQSTNIPRHFDGSPETDLPSPLLVFSPDQQTLAVRSGNVIQLWDIAGGRLQRTLSGHQDVVTSLVYSPDGSLLVSASGTGEQKIFFWNPQDGTLMKTLEGWTVSKLFFSQNGEYLFGEGDDAVRIWRMSDDRLITTLQGVVGDIAYSPDGLLIAFTSCSETKNGACVEELVSLYKILEGKVSWSSYGFTNDITGIHFSPDGQTVASSAGNGIIIANTSNGLVKNRLYEAGNLVNVSEFMFSPDGSILISTWANREVRIWNTQDGSLIHTFRQPVERMAFSPDNTLWAVLSNNTISLWGIK
jgi:WD40 repeat protein